jgi:hypothetical protein
VSDAGWVRSGHRRGRTSAAVAERAEDRIRGGLDLAEVTRLRELGSRLSDEEVAAMALSETDDVV